MPFSLWYCLSRRTLRYIQSISIKNDTQDKHCLFGENNYILLGICLMVLTDFFSVIRKRSKATISYAEAVLCDKGWKVFLSTLYLFMYLKLTQMIHICIYRSSSKWSRFKESYWAIWSRLAKTVKPTSIGNHIRSYRRHRCLPVAHLFHSSHCLCVVQLAGIKSVRVSHKCMLGSPLLSSKYTVYEIKLLLRLWRSPLCGNWL